MVSVRLLMINIIFSVVMIASNAYCVQEELVKYSWVQMGADNKKFLRVVSGASSCPVISVDGKKKDMYLYADKDRSFNVVSCMYEIATQDKIIELAGRVLNVASKKIEKIMVIGDTGCRITFYGIVQDCKNGWHFKKIMDNAMKHKPDLIIHIGDYYYREKCLFNNRCKYENTGDNFRTWEDEFFKPAYSALWGGTPWVFARGNHEQCKRGGLGWARFFDFNKECSDKNANYIVEFKDDGLQIVVMDSSSGKNDVNNLDYGKNNFWIVTHVPFKEDEILKLPKNLQLVMSGHIHKAKLDSKNGVLHAIVGNGGAMLENDNDKDAVYEHGFGMINQISGGWLFTVHDYNDTILIEHKVKN